MKNIILTLMFFLGLGLVSFPTLLLAENNHDKTVDEIINDIKANQSVNDVAQLNCEKISAEKFKELGDSVMALMLPNEQEHAFMDQMMGGEKSESLEAMHYAMGKQYLGCWQSGYQFMPAMLGGMGMGGSMMGGGNVVTRYSNSMMPYYNNNMTGMMSFFNPFNMIWWLWKIIWFIFGVLGIVYLFKLITTKKK